MRSLWPTCGRLRALNPKARPPHTGSAYKSGRPARLQHTKHTAAVKPAATCACSLCPLSAQLPSISAPPPHTSRRASNMAATMTTTHMRACASTRTVRAARRVVVVPRATLRTDVKVPATPERKASPSRQAPLAGFEIGFTPDNEVFVGRLAMLGFAGSVVGEALSGGQGALAQLGYDFGLGQTQVGLFLAGLVGFNLLASVLPGAATYRAAQQADEAAAAGPLQDPRITLLSGPAKFFGVTNWGFTPQNELFAGRVAQLGFLASILGELATGLGPVGQLSAETGVPAYAIQAALAAWASFMALTAVDKLTGKKGGSSQRGKTVKQRLLQLAAKPADA